MLLVNNYFTKPAVFNIFVVKYNPVSQSTKLAFCIRHWLASGLFRSTSFESSKVKASNSYLLKSSLKWTCWFILQICTCTKIRTEWLYEYTYCSSANTTNVLYFNPDFIFLIMFGLMKARLLCCKFVLLRQGTMRRFDRVRGLYGLGEIWLLDTDCPVSYFGQPHLKALKSRLANTTYILTYLHTYSSLC